MPFRRDFECLWCGTRHSVRSESDLEGWAQLCPTCLARAGENQFLRFRLRDAIAERGRSRAEPGAAAAPAADRPSEPEVAAGSDADLVAYYEARAGEYDDWYLRRGRYDRGPIGNMAWQADLDAATMWLDALPWSGRIVELAAGTGWWSPLLAGKGELWLYDAADAPLEVARGRLVAHGLTAHIHGRDAWARPDGVADGLFIGFWLSHIADERLGEFLGLVREWLKPGGTFAFIDSLPDPESGARDHPLPADGVAVRRLDDGREFRITKVFRTADVLTRALADAGFTNVDVSSTVRFFVLGRASAPG